MLYRWSFKSLPASLLCPAYLHQHEPPRKKPLSDDPKLVPPDGVATVEELVELKLGIAKTVEAELPEAHVFEWRLSVLPRLEPVGGGKGHQIEYEGGKAGHAGVEERPRRPLGRLLLLVDRVDRPNAAGHPDGAVCVCGGGAGGRGQGGSLSSQRQFEVHCNFFWGWSARLPEKAVCAPC